MYLTFYVLSNQDTPDTCCILNGSFKCLELIGLAECLTAFQYVVNDSLRVRKGIYCIDTNKRN